MRPALGERETAEDERRGAARRRISAASASHRGARGVQRLAPGRVDADDDRRATRWSRIPNSTTVRSSPRARRRRATGAASSSAAATGTYDWVTGTWNVPSVTGETNTHTYSAFWVGLDGDGVSDLVQAGTEQENYNFSFPCSSLSISVYYAWTEFLPQQATEQQIANFPINPGDEIFCEVWIGNAGSGPTLSGAFGVLLLENLTTSESTTVYTPVGTTVVGGSEAVWIMERPSLGTALTDLADYASARMFNAYARKANSPRHRGYVPYQGANNLQITMVNGATTLSTVTPIDTYSMRFDWQHFH